MNLWQRHRAFGGYYRAYRDKIYSFYYYRLDGNRHVAEDLTSEVFVKAYESFDRYDPSVPFSAWIYAIARNHMIDYYRARRDGVPIDELEIADDSDSLYEVIDRSLNAARVEEGLKTLSPAQQEIIRAKYFQEKSTDDIARERSLTPAAVRQQLSRGLRALRSILMAVLPFISH